MSKDTSITVRVDSEIKNRAEVIINNYGLNMSTTIGMLLHQIVRQNAIPLSLALNEPDPVLGGIERARAHRAQGYIGTPACEVAEKMKDTMEIYDAK